jgi:phage shock protein E
VRRSTLLYLTSALFIAVAGCNAEPPASTITGEELARRIDSSTAPLILDVRSESEFSSGRVPGAMLVPHTELAARVSELGAAADDEVVVYCERGGRAGDAATTLEAAGFTNIRHLEGDMSAWRDSGLPCEGC